MRESPLELRFLQNLRRLGLSKAGERLLVAYSGGLDSTVLLHLLRQQTSAGLTVLAAHFDHRMRADSSADAEWVAALCRAWEVPLELGVATAALTSEATARDARYAFLRSAAARLGATRIVTAHHADDQAETVLFRIVRGTGLRGLAGIPARTRTGLLRPLLPFWRAELEAYAEQHGLEWRVDSTNSTTGPARNRLRLQIIPLIEEQLSHDARRHLVQLADLAREAESGWRQLAADAWRRIARVEKGEIFMDRSGFREQPPAVQSRLAHGLMRRLGLPPTRLGTRGIVTFITEARSGRELELPGGWRMRTEFDRVRISSRGGDAGEDESVTIEELELASTRWLPVRFGGRSYRVELKVRPPGEEHPETEAIWKAEIPTSVLRFPLQLRARRPGDRIETAAGTKSIKKLMIEKRVPQSERARRPLLIDADGRVLWVPGVHVVSRLPHPNEPVLELAVHDG